MTESLSVAPPAGPLPGVRVLFTAEQIQARVRELGLRIARDYASAPPILVGVLKGACMFQCDLARAIALDVGMDFVSISSYGAGTTSSGAVRLIWDLRDEVAGRPVLVCEGVVDSGLTLSFIMERLRARGPANVKVATLLDKRPCRKVQVPLDYVGWEIGSEYVIGYGMDAAERYRNLPFVGVVEEA